MHLAVCNSGCICSTRRSKRRFASKSENRNRQTIAREIFRKLSLFRESPLSHGGVTPGDGDYLTVTKRMLNAFYKIITSK